MPFDPYAALTALIRAEASRAAAPVPKKREVSREMRQETKPRTVLDRHKRNKSLRDHSGNLSGGNLD